jgi:hypothetical protein
VSRLTNLGWLCDSCYELLNRSDLGRRLYRLVYQFSGRESGVSPLARRALSRAGVPASRAAAVPEGGRATGTARDEERAEALVA